MAGDGGSLSLLKGTGTEGPKSSGLQVRGLRAGYGVMEVVHGVDLEVAPGELVALLGRNGAGKTTVLAATAGIRRGRNDGEVRLDGLALHERRPAQVAAAGLALVPEGRRIFTEMTVRENLRLGAFIRRRSAASEIEAGIGMMIDLFPPLGIYIHRKVGELSGGEQQMVAIAQALMARPRVLLLDEPTAGLAPLLAEELYSAAIALAGGGVGVLVVDQDMHRALEYSSRVYVMEAGKIALAGTSMELRSGSAVEKILRGIDR